MADRFVIANVRRLPMFARLDSQQLDWVASVTQVQRYEPGEEMFQQGAVAQGMMMLISGSGLLVQRGSDGIERPFGKVSAGEYINDAALFNDITTEATLRAAESTIVLSLSRQQMRNLLTHRPKLRANLVLPTLPKSQTQQVQQFENQRENEDTLLKTRRHIGAFIIRAFGLGLLIVLMWFGGAFLASAIPGFPVLLIALPVTALLLILIAYQYFEWANDELIITDRRVVSIQRTIINFKTQINEIPLDGIHEVNVALPPLSNVAGRLFGYGSIIIKTSGDTNNIRLDEIPNPKAVQQAIFTHRKTYEQAQQEANRNAMRGQLTKAISGNGKAANTTGSTDPTSPPSQPGLFTLEYMNDKGETVFRKHWLILLTRITLPLILAIIGVTIFITGVIGPIIPAIIVVLSLFWLYIADWDWRNDLYIVGDQTVTLIHRRPFFLQDAKDQILLAQVDNVVSDTQGILNTIFQIGQVKLLLTGTDEKNAKRFINVYNPQHIQQEISRRQDRAAALKRQEDAQRQQQTIIDYLSVYHETAGLQPNPNSDPSNQPMTPAQTTGTYSTIQSASSYAGNAYPTEEETPEPPRIRDRSRPPGIPRVRRDAPPGT